MVSRLTFEEASHIQMEHTCHASPCAFCGPARGPQARSRSCSRSRLLPVHPGPRSKEPSRQGSGAACSVLSSLTCWSPRFPPQVLWDTAAQVTPHLHQTPTHCMCVALVSQTVTTVAWLCPLTDQNMLSSFALWAVVLVEVLHRTCPQMSVILIYVI